MSIYVNFVYILNLYLVVFYGVWIGLYAFFVGVLLAVVCNSRSSMSCGPCAVHIHHAGYGFYRASLNTPPPSYNDLRMHESKNPDIPSRELVDNV